MTMTTCTWEGCTAVAIYQERDRQGKPWAHLCQEHHAALEQALDSGDAKKTLSTWAKAQGRERFLASMEPAVQVAARLGQFLQTLQNKKRG
jgi:predicted membrane chloride channel (bestrophin family)